MVMNIQRRSASGARQAGDEFQHLVAWSRLLRALQSGSPVQSVELEALGAGNVDDVVIRYEDGPGEYTQVRYAVDASHPLDEDYLLASKTNGTSLLQKFHSSWKLLKEESREVTLQLITNRLPDPQDPVLARLDGRTSSLVPALRRSGASAQRRSWSQHLDVDEAELMDLLAALKIRAGCQYANELERVKDLMLLAGLENDDSAVARCVNLMRSWVLDGLRSVGGVEVLAAIDSLDLRATDPAALLLIQTIAREPDPFEADEVLDWVDYFEGESPKTRRRAADGGYERMDQELRSAAGRLRASGVRRVVVRGSMRLPSWFAAGEALSEVNGVVVTCGQRGQQWSSDCGDGIAEVATRVISEPNAGEALAVAVGFAADLGPDVVEFVASSDLPVRAVIEINHTSGRRIADARESVNTAGAIKQRIRSALRELGCQEVHLFLSTPAALALHLGHQWNRVSPTTVWEDLGLDGYQAAFTVEA